MVTGPIPRKPKATRPKANTAGAIIKAPNPAVLTRNPIVMSDMIAKPSQ